MQANDHANYRHIRFYKDDLVKESIETEMYNLQQSYRDRIELLQDRFNQEHQEENPGSYFQNEETSATTSTARSPSTPILQESSDTSISLTPQALKTTQKPVDAGFVLEKLYRKITPLSLQSASSINISLDIKAAIPKLKELKKAMEASDLLTLVSGDRRTPNATEDNPSGYIGKSVKMILNKKGLPEPIVIQEDDCYSYAAERGIAFQLLMQMIDPNLHHIIKEEILDKDPKSIYTIICKHFAGHKHHHIENAK